MLIGGLFMKPNFFQYPKKMYNEWEVLEIYKEKFPEIVEEYESIARNTYCNPSEYKQLVEKKAEKFDENMKTLTREFESKELNLTNLLKISFDLHYNYAMNFWIISYAFNEGPLSEHYIELIGELLKKIYKNETSFINAREDFIKTDYPTFYHKILLDSVELTDLLNKIPSIQGDLNNARELSPVLRNEVYNKIIDNLKNSGLEESKRILKKWDKHLRKENLFPIYNLLNQSIDNYEKNKLLDKELKDTDFRINETFILAKKSLNKEDYGKLEGAYLLIKEMLRAKDDIFGRKDLELFAFWNKLTYKIISLAENEAKIKIEFNKERSNLIIPWILEDKLPEHQKDTLKSLQN